MSEQLLGSVNGHVEITSKVEHVMRLDCTDVTSWSLYPRFMERCLRFAQDLLKFNEMQLKNFEQDLRNRWATPNGSLFLAVMDGRGNMVGHVCGWINIDYGQPYLFNFQAEVDEGYEMAPAMDLLAKEHVEYVGWANAMYEKGGQPVRINKVRTQTMRNADALVRYLSMHGMNSVIERTTIGWDI